MRDKIKTLDKNNEKSKLRKIAKKQKLQERGITLIALVVTIIILLILAGVTLNIALSDNGLFSKTKKAAEDYKQAQSEEEDLISQFATQMYSEYVGATVIGYDLMEKEVTIESETSGLSDNKDSGGKIINGVDENGNQTFTTEKGMNWKVWDFDGNTLRIIGDPTSKTLTLKGVAGYNNGVWALDYICKELYSNKEKGTTATNLKRTDIQKVSTYDYTKYKHAPGNWKEDTTSGNEYSIYFGATNTYPENNKYPDMWSDNDEDWTYEYNTKNKTATGGDKECKTWEVIGNGVGKMNDNVNKGDNNTTFKQSFYAHEYKENEFINDKYYDLIFKRTDGNTVGYYWLAGRYAHLWDIHCDFGLQRVSGSSSECLVDGDNLFSSSQTESKYILSYPFRAIVSIDLTSNGYTMTSSIDENGKMTVSLKLKNE